MISVQLRFKISQNKKNVVAQVVMELIYSDISLKKVACVSNSSARDNMVYLTAFFPQHTYISNFTDVTQSQSGQRQLENLFILKSIKLALFEEITVKKAKIRNKRTYL